MQVKVLKPGDNIKEIVQIFCEDIDTWYRYPSEKKEVSTYEELTVQQRVMHGGPWMDETALQQWLDFIYKIGGVSYTAIVNNRVIGYVECLRCYEPEPYGKYVFINVIQVAKKWRRQGIGTTLTKHVIQEAVKMGFSNIDAQPDENYLRICKKLGMNTFKIFYEVYHDIRIFDELPESRKTFSISTENINSNIYKYHPLILNHILPSGYIWNKLYYYSIIWSRTASTFPSLKITSGDFYQFVASFLPLIENRTVDLYLFANVQYPPEDYLTIAIATLLKELYKKGITRVITRCEENYLKVLTSLGFKKTGMRYEYVRFYEKGCVAKNAV